MTSRSQSVPALLLTLVFVMVGAAGCLGGSSGTATSGSSSPTAGATAPAATNASAANQTPDAPPMANFTVADAGGAANLTAGHDILFNASASTDPAGGNLSYAWAFGNESATGVLANHSFAAAGNYTIVLTVTSSASHLNATTNRTIVVGSSHVKLAPIKITGTVTGAWAPQVGYTATNSHKFMLLAQPAKMTLHLAWSGDTFDLDYDVYSPDGKQVAREANYNEPTGTAYDAGEPDIVIEDAKALSQVGEWTVHVQPGNVSYNAAYTVTITFE